ncbi:response regulator [Effusibacillus dendaii]|uniref:Response regulatory domain-containing protein n=1 Tax=Effusibacillus dendaii TaxID=2743772 RepID=A0A7I8D9V1_9BACL|nr:response regulator [Effusibacillus dendaii]BCJ86894.1 hypothetical protein skT53_18790 [Effusibacillus dendaii]
MGKKILIVDDEPYNLKILNMFLSSLSFEIFEAVSGKEALRIVQSHTPDLILIDVMMPGISGIELCQMLSNRPGFTAPIIFLSARVQQEDIQIGLKAGAVEYLTKPIDLDLLHKTINFYLKKI